MRKAKRRGIVFAGAGACAGGFALWNRTSRRARGTSCRGHELEILHLAFEDHKRPGSGGGGLRTHEINKRLAEHHRITVVTTKFPGAKKRVEDGVSYRPLGLPLGYYGAIASYHLLTPFLVMSKHPDLVVEDFAAPMSSSLVPLWTRQPTIAIVQWLFADETSERYGVPFHLFESWGVRLHRRFVAVSEYMAAEIRARNPRALVEVVPGGVEGIGRRRARRGSRSAGIVYLGRLQEDAKGLDLLLGAFAQAAEEDPALRLTIAGDGPYRPAMEALSESLGVAGHVRFVGRVEGDAKYQLLSQASVVAVPSRFESFGLVVIEAFAAGTPVVAFDIPAMRELVAPSRGILVPPFDVAAFASALGTLASDPDRAEQMGEEARRYAAGYSWDAAAVAQEKAYLAAVEGYVREGHHLRPRRRRRDGSASAPAAS